jgi:hypothetical protein
MKWGRTMLSLLAVLALFAGTVVLSAESADLPGITVKDPYPNGCVDCHIPSGAGEKSPLVTAELAKVSGHPKIDKIVKTIPKDCSTLCHKVGGKAPAFNLVMHKAHFEKPEDNRFVTVNKGACLTCHSMNPDTGGMIEKSGPRNW